MLEAAATTFEVLPSQNSLGLGQDAVQVQKVFGPLKTTVLMLKQNKLKICLISSHITLHTRYLCETIRKEVAAILGIPTINVLVMSAHNHCAVHPSDEPTLCWWHGERQSRGDSLNKTGKDFVNKLGKAVRKLPDDLVPVNVSYACGKEGRISYNRKGRHDDGSTYMMREEDRGLLGKDFRGEIVEDAPVVMLKNDQGNVVCSIVQYTAHPVTAYHPERPVVCGEYPQAACDQLAAHLSANHAGSPVPVAFFQGCAGNINTKGFLSGDVERSERYGRYLGQTYRKACRHLKASQTNELRYETARSRLPYARLPSQQTLARELDEIKQFVRRAREGDDDTFSCVGLNFPRAFTPQYRGKLAEAILPWTRWALRKVREDKHGGLPSHLETEVYALRLGNVGIIGMEGEPFLGIGQQIQERSPMALTIPCGYTNVSYGYIPDGANTGDREYMSAFYRYTRYRPPFRKPAGDVWATTAVRLLEKLHD